VPYEIDQPIEKRDVPYQVSSITRSCSGLERGGSFVESLDASTQEDLREPSHDHRAREHVSNIIRLYFDKQLVVTQAQILHGLIKHKKLKCATKFLGFRHAKSRKVLVNVTKNISKSFSKFGKSRKLDVQVACREITIVIVVPITSRQQMEATMSKFLHF
jgi:hypothetical protein